MSKVTANRKIDRYIKTKSNEGLRINISFGQLVITAILFAVTFVIPARVYDLYSPNQEEKGGNVAGIYTDAYYNKSSNQDNENSQGQVKGINFTEPKYSLVTLAGIVTVVTALILVIVYVQEEYKYHKYNSPEL